jgi:hypothetical protein
MVSKHATVIFFIVAFCVKGQSCTQNTASAGSIENFICCLRNCIIAGLPPAMDGGVAN